MSSTPNLIRIRNCENDIQMIEPRFQENQAEVQCCLPIKQINDEKIIIKKAMEAINKIKENANVSKGPNSLNGIKILSSANNKLKIEFNPGPIGILTIGNVVKCIETGSQADRAGIQAGMTIHQINDENIINNKKVVIKAIQKIKHTRTVIVFYNEESIVFSGVSSDDTHFHLMGRYLKRRKIVNGKNSFKQVTENPPCYIWWYSECQAWFVGDKEDIGTNTGYMRTVDNSKIDDPGIYQGQWYLASDNESKWRETEKIFCQSSHSSVNKGRQ